MSKTPPWQWGPPEPRYCPDENLLEDTAKQCALALIDMAESMPEDFTEAIARNIVREDYRDVEKEASLEIFERMVESIFANRTGKTFDEV